MGAKNSLPSPLFNAGIKSMLTGTRGDAPEPTRRSLVDETPPDQAGMALHHPRVREPGHTRTRDSPLHRAGPWNDPTMDPPSKGSLAGLLGQSAGPGKTTNGQKPRKDKHLSPLTLRVKSITERPIPATAGARTSLGGFRECLPV